uniref:SHSP domain-containing protein n=1 Tax=Parascaris univalens TaxID=6257 RepID=A0A915AZV7_PARUN
VMRMDHTDEPQLSIAVVPKSSIADQVPNNFHNHGLYPHWTGGLATTTHHPVNPLDFYSGSELTIELDVSQFRRDDLTIYLRGNLLIIEGAHEARNEDQCTVERRFVREFQFPPHKHYECIVSEFSQTGVLRITLSK